MFWEFELTNLLNEVVGWVLAVGSSLHFIWGATRILVYNDAETICKLWKMWLHLYSITQDWCEQMSNFVKNVIVLFPGPVWVCPDRRRRGGQRHPQSSAPVKPVRPRPASCLTDCPLPRPDPFLPRLFSLWRWLSWWRMMCFSNCPSYPWKHVGKK